MPKPLVLLVDDAPEMGDIVAYLNRRLGFDTEVCADVPAAWTYLQSRRPDLMLVDVNLPGVSGAELCRKVCREPRLGGIPVALFSSWMLPHDVAAGLEAGAEYVVSKELVSRPKEWQERLREILDARDSRGVRLPVTWLQGDSTTGLPSDWTEALHRAVRAALYRSVGLEVWQVVLRKVLRRQLTPSPSAEELDSLISPDGGLSFPPSSPPATEAAVALLVALVNEVWCLLGTAASRPVWVALAASFPDRFTVPPN
jgi:CheY-like chemotaxis protein